MFAEYSAECGAEDPVLVVPWSASEAEAAAAGASLGPRFVDLREDPYALEEIPEAEQHPALLHALRALNAPRSPVFTAKCDAWVLDADELAAVQGTLMTEPAETGAGFASYIDLLWRERATFVSFHASEQTLHRLARHAEALDDANAALECVLRPALVDLTGPQEGFAVSLYVKALGADAAVAYRNWADALAAVVGLIRSV